MAQDIKIHRHKKFGAAQRAARVTALHGMRHADDVAPDLGAEAGELFFVFDGIHEGLR